MNTILDVAKLAGVSKSTVSRVLNHPESVKPETLEAITRAMKQLNYTPSYFAQGIRTGRTKTIALLVPDYSNSFYAQMFMGAEEVALKEDYMILICNTHKGVERERKYIEKLVSRNIDGIIYNTYNRNRGNINYLIELSNHLPVVFMDHIFEESDNVSYVLTEGTSSTAEAVKYLYSKGRRKIGYIKMTPGASVLDNRYAGYIEGLNACGLQHKPEMVYLPLSEVMTNEEHTQIGEQAAEYFMQLPEKPDAIVAAFDVMAIGCMLRLKEHGISIPDDIAIIGFDDIPLCTMVDPSLSTIAQPAKKIGTTAAEIIMAELLGKKVDNKVTYDGRLILREST